MLRLENTLIREKPLRAAFPHTVAKKIEALGRNFLNPIHPVSIRALLFRVIVTQSQMENLRTAVLVVSNLFMDPLVVKPSLSAIEQYNKQQKL